MALRPDSWIGGQLTMGIAPEYTNLGKVRLLGSSILEMACTLLCHYCKATGSSISSADRSTPAVTVLYGTLNFLHEFTASVASDRLRSSAFEGDTVEYLEKLDNALRSGQQLGSNSEGPPGVGDGGGLVLEPAALAFDSFGGPGAGPGDL